MRIAFTKMHGAGNDVIIFDAPSTGELPSAAQFRALGNRRTGIGFDQAMVLLPPRAADTRIYYRIFNADGGEVEQCGNGARCVAALLRQRGAPAEFTMDSTGGRIAARVVGPTEVAINMGVPDFAPTALPFKAGAQLVTYELQVEGATVEFGAVSMGNPHAVLHVTDVTTAPVEHLGQALQARPEFPRQVNVGFMQVVDSAHIRLRVYERGVGETLACGTGACAAVCYGRQLGLLGASVEVHVPGGRLSVNWQGAGQPVWLTGPAEVAFRGEVEI
jgi:diaminopimelate epimerase